MNRKALDIFLVMVGVIMLTAIGYYFHQESEKEKKAEEINFALKEKVLWDLKNHYRILRELAPRWNSLYAQLSLNETRDTIVHPKYTVRELTFLHDRIMSEIYNYSINVYIQKEAVDISQLSGLFPPNNDFQDLIGTYKKREKLYSSATELNQIYTTLLSNITLKDTVETSWNPTSIRYYPYFSALNKLDRLIYNLLSDNYPNNLKFVINSEPEFKKEAEEQLLTEQIFAFRNPSNYRIYTSEAKLLKQELSTCIADSGNQIINFEVEVNSGKTLLLIAMDTIKSNETAQVRTQLVEKFEDCFAKVKQDYQKDLYVYLEDSNKTYIKTPVQQKLIEGALEKTKYFHPFYEEGSTNYLVEGTYAPLYVWYPYLVSEEIAETKKRR